jgi:hypothetical protein
VIHPTLLIKTLFKFFRPFLSSKFWVKLKSVSRMNTLYEYINKNDLPLPPSVLTHEYNMSLKNKEDFEENFKQNQFFKINVSTIMQRKEEVGRKIPRYMELLINHIEKNIESVGIFRVSATQEEVMEIKHLMDNGYNIDISYCHINCCCDLFKIFLREMPEPVLNYGN